jgi:two-component system, chemotaxis family, protein-glutamate methylesterase/glutaminase
MRHPLSSRRSGPIRVLIVDDSAIVRETMADLINSDPDLQVMGKAADPFAAALIMREETPDVILLDVEMPKMDGLTFLRRIMAQHPLPVLMCSSHAAENSDMAHEAMAAGAVDVICKPRVGVRSFLEESRTQLCDAVRAAAGARLSALRQTPVEVKQSADAILPSRPSRGGAPLGGQLIAIGASTGGTEALKVLLQALPPDCPPIIIVQHMPEAFTGPFSRRLNEACPMTVREARQGDKVLAGTVLIAPGDHHMLLRRAGSGYAVDIREGPLVSRHRPSVDVLFRSVAQNAGSSAIGVILTGMGDDGARGLKEMRDAGAHTFGQDEASCVVYGMPGEAMRAGAVEQELPLSKLPAALMRQYQTAPAARK